MFNRIKRFKVLISGVAILTFSSMVFASLSDVDLEVRTIIAEELSIDPDEVHSLKFVDSTPSCPFVIQAFVDNNSCKVCFQGDVRNPLATDVVCERIWLFNENEE